MHCRADEKTQTKCTNNQIGYQKPVNQNMKVSNTIISAAIFFYIISIMTSEDDAVPC